MTNLGDDRAATFDALRGRLLSLAGRVLGSRAEAEDVVQDAWFRWRLADADAVRVPHAWLATVTVRLAIDRLRRLRRERAGDEAARVGEPWRDDAAPSAEEMGLLAARISEGLLRMLDRLAPIEQAVFALREGFDCDYAEISALVGCTPAHCRQIVHRAKARLARDAACDAPADPARHAQAVERLREVLDAQDRAGLMRLFGVAAAVPLAEVRPGVRPDVQFDTQVDTQPVARAAGVPVQAARAEVLSLDGVPGVAFLASDGELVTWVPVVVAGGAAGVTIVCVGPAARARRLQAFNRRIGGRAIRLLLAAIAAGRYSAGTAPQVVSPVAELTA